MRTLSEINADIAKVKSEMQDVHGTTTEVYARIVGYYRSVRNWNPGKRDEYNQRKLFVADEGRITEHLPTGEACDCAAQSETDCADSPSVARYELFVRKTCPNCPPVKDECATLAMEGELIDVDSAEGFARASAYGVFSAPTVIFFDSEGTETFRAHTAKEIRAALATVNAEGALSAAV